MPGADLALPHSGAGALREWVRGLPKAELHIHLEGAMREGIERRLAARHGIEPPAVGSAAAGGGSAEDRFRAFVERYLFLSSLLRTADDVADATADVAGWLAEQGVIAAEVTFTVWTHRRRGLAEDALRAGLRAGRARARAAGVELSWVFDIVRAFPDQALPTLEFALRLREEDPQGVAGLGLAGPEGERWPTAPFIDVFARARDAGLAALPHAGEFRGARAVREAIELLGARRIGHGIRCLEDASVVRLVRERGVCLEVCPSSNVALGVVPSWEEHPLPRLLAAGIECVVASDDPALFGSSLEDEWVRAAETWGWPPELLQELAARTLAARATTAAR